MSAKVRTIIVVLGPIFLVAVMVVAGGGGSRRAGRMESHIRKDHPRVFEEDHLSPVCSRGSAWPVAGGHMGVASKIQHEGQ